MIVSRWIHLRMRNISDTGCRENQNTHFTVNKFFLQIAFFYELMWKKCGTARQAADDKKTHARCELGT